MTDPSDGIPRQIILGERSRRETAELCGAQVPGAHCTLTKGHAGKHECLALRGPIRWGSQAS